MPSSNADAPRLRIASPGEADAITALGLRSKRLWGYGEAFMAAIAPVMRITEADIETAHVEVLETDERLLGFLRLEWRADHAWLHDLFVAPDVVGHGHGRRLLEGAAELARARGYEVMRFDSDPHAEAFYLHLGAVRVGTSPSEAVPGRRVPLMELRLSPATADAEVSEPTPG